MQRKTFTIWRCRLEWVEIIFSKNKRNFDIKDFFVTQLVFLFQPMIFRNSTSWRSLERYFSRANGRNSTDLTNLWCSLEFISSFLVFTRISDFSHGYILQHIQLSFQWMAFIPYLFPIFFFCLQASMEVTQEANCLIKVSGWSYTEMSQYIIYDVNILRVKKCVPKDQ